MLHAYHTEGQNIADHRVLRTLGTRAGLSPGRVRELLAGTAFTDEVRADERRAADNGITGVPTLLVDGGPPISAVQEPAALAALLARATDT
ncbi:DsbA family protein [Embleya sp. NPDC001921]